MGPAPEMGSTLERHQLFNTEMGLLQGVQDSCILERKNRNPRGLIPVVCYWEPHDPDRQEQLVQALREELGFPEMGKQVLWFLPPPILHRVLQR